MTIPCYATDRPVGRDGGDERFRKLGERGVAGAHHQDQIAGPRFLRDAVAQPLAGGRKFRRASFRFDLGDDVGRREIPHRGAPGIEHLQHEDAVLRPEHAGEGLDEVLAQRDLATLRHWGAHVLVTLLVLGFVVWGSLKFLRGTKAADGGMVPPRSMNIRNFFEVMAESGAETLRHGPMKPRGVAWNGAGGWLIFSQSRQENFSRTVSITFHWRGTTSSVRVTSSPSLRSTR